MKETGSPGDGVAGRVVDQAGGPHGGAEHAGALGGKELDLPGLADPRAQEPAAAVGARPVEAGGQADALRQAVLDAHPAQG